MFAAVIISSCNKQESKSDLNIQIKTSILPAHVKLYKNNSLLDSINFQIDGSIGFWDIDVPVNTTYRLEVVKVNINDTGVVNIKWLKSANLVQQDLLNLDSLSQYKTVNFNM